MSFEKEYYEFERFWKDHESIYRINIEKINITFSFIGNDVNSILDAGCGNGIFTNMALERFPDKKIVGFDRSDTALKYVRAEKFHGSIDEIPFSDDSFDCVVAHDIIEHLPVNVYVKAIGELARVAGKYIIVAVPNEENLEENVSKCPCCKTIFNNNLHFRSFTKEKLSGVFREAGFTCVDVKTCDRNAFYVGQRLYGNLFYPEWQTRFRSPICPLCGYKNPDDVEGAKAVEDVPGRSLLSRIKRIPKMFWPKYSKDYEMVALFAKGTGPEGN